MYVSITYLPILIVNKHGFSKPIFVVRRALFPSIVRPLAGMILLMEIKCVVSPECDLEHPILCQCWARFRYELMHWGWVMHISVSKLTITGSDSGLSPGRRQAIIWTNAGLLLIEPLGTNFAEFLIKIHIFSYNAFEIVIWKMAAILSRPQCVNVCVSLRQPSKDWWVSRFYLIYCANTESPYFVFY